MPMRFFAFERKNPVEWMISSSSSGLAAARSAGVGYRANTAGVTLLTISSVHCADRIVAIRSWNGLSWCNAHSSVAVPGYSARQPLDDRARAAPRHHAACESSWRGRPRPDATLGPHGRSAGPPCPHTRGARDRTRSRDDRRAARRAPRVRRRGLARPRGAARTVAGFPRGRGTRDRRLLARDGSARRRPRARLRPRRPARVPRRRGAPAPARSCDRIRATVSTPTR